MFTLRELNRIKQLAKEYSFRIANTFDNSIIIKSNPIKSTGYITMEDEWVITKNIKMDCYDLLHKNPYRVNLKINSRQHHKQNKIPLFTLNSIFMKIADHDWYKNKESFKMQNCRMAKLFSMVENGKTDYIN